jgi:hypothetical protein
MEGTSGAAECADLRGSACEAALSWRACGSRDRDARRRASVGERGGPWEARAPRLWRSRCFRTALVTVHDMGCSSRSGRGQAPPASDRGGRGCEGVRHCRANHATPDPWNLGWPARASETGHPQPGTCPKGRDLREKSCTSGRLRVWCCGARTFVVVLVDRFDCRSRQAVPGIARPRAKSARKRTLPSHPSREQRAVNGSRKPAPRGQARSTVTGSHPKPWVVSLASLTGCWRTREHLPMEGVSGRRKQSPLTRRRWRRSSTYANG